MASLGELQDRLAQLQEGLEELRQLIGRLGGGDAAKQQQQQGDSATAYATTSATLPAPEFFFLDEDTAAELVGEIADGLRETQDDYELLQEDAADLALAASASDIRRDASPGKAGGDAEEEGGRAGKATTAAEDIHDRARLKDGLARLGAAIQQHHVAFRGARLHARRAMDAARVEEHRQLLVSYGPESEEDSEDEQSDDEEGEGESDEERSDEEEDHSTSAHSRARQPRPRTRRRAPLPAPHHQHKHASPTTAAAADVTAALRQTHARIAGEVARSDFAAQTLAESSRALAELGDRYTGSGASSGGNGGDIGASLKSARQLVRGLVAAHKSDTWYLQTAFYLLAGTTAWLLFRRVLYGPLWVLVWWPARTALGLVLWAGRAGLGSRGKSVSSVSSISVGNPGTSVITSVVTATASVAAADVHATPAAAADSLVEEVGRIVDGEAAEARADGDEPNPMKRMWEEDVEAAKYEEQQQREKEEEEAQGKEKDAPDGERKKDEL